MACTRTCTHGGRRWSLRTGNSRKEGREARNTAAVVVVTSILFAPSALPHTRAPRAHSPSFTATVPSHHRIATHAPTPNPGSISPCPSSISPLERSLLAVPARNRHGQASAPLWLLLLLLLQQQLLLPAARTAHQPAPLLFWR